MFVNCQEGHNFQVLMEMNSLLRLLFVLKTGHAAVRDSV